MTTTERKWKPGDRFWIKMGDGPQMAKIERIVTICGIDEFALHRDGTCLGTTNVRYVVSHIPTGFMVGWGDSPKQALLRAHSKCIHKGGAAAIRAAVERHK